MYCHVSCMSASTHCAIALPTLGTLRTLFCALGTPNGSVVTLPYP